jgi:hypothetical protein
MEKFRDYDHLVSWMTARGRKSKYSPVLEYLAIEVEKEVRALMRRAVLNDVRTHEEIEQECEKDAKEHYVEEINEFLDNWPPKPLDHRILMSYRRKPVAWAVASEIYRLETE